jgi:hypothetical protein
MVCGFGVGVWSGARESVDLKREKRKKRKENSKGSVAVKIRVL